MSGTGAGGRHGERGHALDWMQSGEWHRCGSARRGAASGDGTGRTSLPEEGGNGTHHYADHANGARRS